MPPSILEPPDVSEELLDASDVVTEAIEEGDLSAARAALAGLSAPEQLGSYSLAVAGYFLTSSVTVEELKVLQAYVALLRDPTGAADDDADDAAAADAFAALLSGAHADAVAFFVAARDPDGETKYSYDDNIRAAGSLMHAFAVLHPFPLPTLTEDESPEARACARSLNTYDESVRINEAASAGRQRFGNWVTARLGDVKTADSADACADACAALPAEGLGVADLLLLAPEDALNALRLTGRRALDGMVVRACDLYGSDRAAGTLVSSAATGAQGKCLPHVEKLLRAASAVVALLAQLDRDDGDDSVAAFLGVKLGGGLGSSSEDGDEDDEDDEDAAEEAETETVNLLADDAPLKAPGVLAQKHLTALALAELSRPAVYAAYLRHFCREVLRGRCDVSSDDGNSRRHDPSLLAALTSANPYDARDANLAAYKGALAAVLEERLASGGVGGDGSDSSLAARAAALADVLKLPDGSQQAAAQGALAAAAKARAGAPAADTATPLAAASAMLGLDASALEKVVAAEAQAQATASVGARLAAYVATAAATSFSQPLVAFRALRLAAADANCAAESVAVAAAAAAALQAALAAEQAGDLAGAKSKFRSAAALPLLLDGGAGDDEPVGSAPAVRALGTAVRALLSEDADEAVSELCWELEDSGEPENEALAKGVLTLLGMR